MQFQNTKALFFDFDGTLVDSVPDLALAVNNMLDVLGKAAFSENDIRSWVGNGPELLVARALSGSATPDKRITPTELNHALTVFTQCYEKNMCVNTMLYPCVKETIRTLHGQYAMAIITNKPHRFVEPILSGVGLSGLFDLIIGSDTLPERKPQPEPLLFAARHFDLSVHQCVMVGDSKNDILAAKSAGMPSVGVSYGYNYGVPISQYEPDYVVNDFSALLTLLSE
ncbi:phosphoglycolate phosphatase [Aurantivibrio plasticivorans]